MAKRRDSVKRHRATRWAYHATDSRRIPLVKEFGLLGAGDSDSLVALAREPKARGWRRVLWFTSHSTDPPEWYGDSLFRFPWPRRFVHGIEDGEYATDIPVPASKVEILMGGRWVALEGSDEVY